MDNQTIAQRLLDYADQLEGRDSNVYRIRAYRRAAQTVLELDRPVAELIAEQGRGGLEALPGIGSHLSYTIEGLVKTGEFRTVNMDDGHIDPEQILTTLPGVGPGLARQIHEELGITRLEELEQAAHDGRLAKLGVGPKRLRGLIDALAGRLARNRFAAPVVGEPDVATLLAVDQEYRDLAERKTLPTVSPRRFNPQNEPWLPVFQVSRDGWYFRAAFSNTA
ncbi:MAG TPA: helix-hairpin-helix domain-containing protein, partial [Gemmataceae bacterium]|nr:helix-hairpin-helix domain-containing protein [Gemmataceae bacterium]